ncbi:MAG: hypothetical protein A2086_02835 [Spirochaetes bacterium GWD1_27_9]|nr:MAG: hypothetical protein A2Y34_17165 [Spirochaetes bacterium GWC1_27_15]OHD31387.1 MAG: hypothetical protein A2086_02835 [Spirochaetes bacterium GWD1_27_9]
MQVFKFPDSFEFGVATSSLQIEGGDKNNNWFRLSEEGKIKDGVSSFTACDHWNKIDCDIELIKSLNCKIYKMSLEWSRIQPKKDYFDKNAINHYRDEIKKLKENNIEPIVSLHHFSNPIWFEDIGGFTNPESVKLFEIYTEYVLRNLGDLVTEWITINKPNTFIYNTYANPNWRTGTKDKKKYSEAARNVIISHINSYKKIKEILLNSSKREVKIGISLDLSLISPKNNNFFDKNASNNFNNLLNETFVCGMVEGKIDNNYPFGKGKYCDFFGINYFFDYEVKFVLNLEKDFTEIEEKESNNLYIIGKKYYNQYKLPIYITENGIDDFYDKKRIKFIYENILQIKKLIDDGIDVRKYCYWSLMDDFEWFDGYSKKFGLIDVDFNTQKRTLKRSGEFFSLLAKNNGITEEVVDKFKNQ